MSRFFAVVLIAVAATDLRAQSLDSSALKVDGVVVTTTDESLPVPGKLMMLGPETLTILTAGGPQTLPLDSVVRIDARKDSLKNGAIIGAAILGGWCALICGQAIDDGGQAAAAITFNALFGAAVGAGIDALHTGRTPIYQRPNASTAAQASPRLTLSKAYRF